VLTLLNYEAQHDSSDYIFSISKTFFIHIEIFIGEIMVALKRHDQWQHSWQTELKKTLLDAHLPNYFSVHALQGYFKGNV